ncbi:restriction endonuclease [Helicobacter equorum]|uniref:restriction endonuclease n=1 Tax=Helicobacter equorum TaxID=361872 RepID=UPI000CF12802|nr:restriction endonuclease [Helicobacter equorum]
MNYFLEQSIELANQRDYLDQLFRIYPISPDNIREIDTNKWDIFAQAFSANKQNQIIESLLDFDLFPIKDSYVAYLRRDRGAIYRNPMTISRICGRLKDMGLDKIYENISQPKETNRQIGPLFKRWVGSGALGLQPIEMDDFIKTNNNAILSAPDSMMQDFAAKYLGYTRNKGLDFIARFNNKFIIGEAKFLTDFGGHQNAQLEDAFGLLHTHIDSRVIKVAILDGVCYICNNSKMHTTLTHNLKNEHIFSALVLRDFLYQV